jgi:putative solute:sodium symporter small subunit
MRYEVDLFGILVPALLIWIVVSYAIGAVLRRMLERTGFYRFVWHPALFDLALYVCLLGGVVFLSSEFLS